MKCKILVFVVLVVFCITHACEGETVKLKNPAVASGLSFGWTFLPSLPLLYCMATDNEFLPAACVLSFSGFMVGPSTGHFYAENRSWGNKSIGFRSACAGIGLLGGVGALGSIQSEQWGAMDGWIKVSVASGVVIFGSALIDICSCPQAVEKYNQSIQDHGSLYFSPQIDIKDESYGLSISYRF